jgi:uncharacterized protein (DUF433 family)
MTQSTITPSIIRTSRGLTIAGTRITLYSIMDYLKADWPAKLIQDLFDLTDDQIADVLAYIRANSEQVEAEYQLVLQKAEENRNYWMAYNQAHLENVAAMPHDPKNQEIWEKLKARQAKL